MRFNNRITLVTETDSYYDADKGERVPGKITSKEVPCHMSRLGLERRQELFGNVDKVITRAIIRRPIPIQISYVLHKGIKYNLASKSSYRKTALFIEGDLIGK